MSVVVAVAVVAVAAAAAVAAVRKSAEYSAFASASESLAARACGDDVGADRAPASNTLASSPSVHREAHKEESVLLSQPAIEHSSCLRITIHIRQWSITLHLRITSFFFCLILRRGTSKFFNETDLIHRSIFMTHLYMYIRMVLKCVVTEF